MESLRRSQDVPLTDFWSDNEDQSIEVTPASVVERVGQIVGATMDGIVDSLPSGRSQRAWMRLIGRGKAPSSPAVSQSSPAPVIASPATPRPSVGSTEDKTRDAVFKLLFNSAPDQVYDQQSYRDMRGAQELEDRS